MTEQNPITATEKLQNAANELDRIVLNKIESSKHNIEVLRDTTRFLSIDERNLLLTKISDELFFILYVNGRV